ncbi:MAG: glutathione S-transferase family protein [Proteobacteria bacterium]|nr:glutathione S-transferase family protein [Pseudomonadota bacterium]
MTDSKPKLISFKLCPFVQRAVIILKQKKVDYEITYIDLNNKPEWFLQISPFGKVPVLQTGDDVLFESAVICEFLDETNPPSMHPTDAIQRAKNRAWIEFGSSLFMQNYRMAVATTKSDYEKVTGEMIAGLTRLNDQLVKSPFYNGENFSILDACLAPLFQRLFLVEEHSSLETVQKFPKLLAWGKSMSKLDAVQQSVVPEFDELYINFLKDREGSYQGGLLN